MSGGKKTFFIIWYCNQAIHELVGIWENFFFFCWTFFSVSELFSTLFYPWHRDVEIKGWRGFHPIKSLEMFFSNIASRLVGMVVRLFVIAAGILTTLAAVVVGLVALIVWMAMPLFLVAFLLAPSIFPVPVLYVGVASIVWLSVAISAYIEDRKKFATETEDFFLHPAFSRVCARLGITRKKFPRAILENADEFAKFLKARGLAQKDYQDILEMEFSRETALENEKKFWRQENLAKLRPIGMQWRFGYTVNLDRYCTDLSEYDASEYHDIKMIGRKEEEEMLALILERPDQNCVLLAGNEGIGKKSLVHFLAKKVRGAEFKSWMDRERIMLFDIGRAISDAVNNGDDIEGFLRNLFHEAAFAGNVILFIEHIDHFLGKDQNSMHPDISSVLGEYIQSPALQVIATSTQKEYHHLIEKEEQIIKYFEVIEMREPTEDESVEILIDRLGKYENSRVLFTYQALKKIVTLSGKHNWQTPLPERAIDMAMNVLMYWEKGSMEQFITEEEVDAYLSLKTGVAHGEVGNEERKKLLNLEEVLHHQVIGQEEAVRQVAESLRRARSGIGDSQKPVGSFLFLGPTGVGKTETAKALAGAYFGDEKHMIRLDMSEFQTPNSIDRLLGSSELNQPGLLVNKIKDNPYSLLLLDEIEKAYPEILDIFLQILDEGFVTDAFGEKINFRNCIIIATSNVGAALIKKEVEKETEPEKIRQSVIDYAIENGIFRVEFLNRFEGVVFFRPLKGNELSSVVKLQLRRLARRLDKEKNIEITFDNEVIQKIIEKGYNPIFGARSLNRFIEDSVEDLVAKKIISGEVLRGEKISISL